MKFYGISFMHLYKQSRRWQGVQLPYTNVKRVYFVDSYYIRGLEL